MSGYVHTLRARLTAVQPRLLTRREKLCTLLIGLCKVCRSPCHCLSWYEWRVSRAATRHDTARGRPGPCSLSLHTICFALGIYDARESLLRVASPRAITAVLRRLSHHSTSLQVGLPLSAYDRRYSYQWCGESGEAMSPVNAMARSFAVARVVRVRLRFAATSQDPLATAQSEPAGHDVATQVDSHTLARTTGKGATAWHFKTTTNLESNVTTDRKQQKPS